MPKTYLQDIVLMEDLLEELASKGYTFEELEDMFDTAIDELGYFEEIEDEDEY